LVWELERIPVVPTPIRLFQNGEAWTPVPSPAGWWVHSGSGYSVFRDSTGIFRIDFLKKKTTFRVHKIILRADCPDDNDCITYSLDGHNFSTKVVSGGSTVLDEKKPHGMDDNSSFHLQFEISANTIVVTNRAGTVLSAVARQSAGGKLAIQDDNPIYVN
jgi:hypothetical protein